MKFAKLFDVTHSVFGDSQVLFRMEYDDEKDKYIVHITTCVEGITVELKAAFDEEDEAQGFLDNSDQLSADIQYRNVCKMIMEG